MLKPKCMRPFEIHSYGTPYLSCVVIVQVILFTERLSLSKWYGIMSIQWRVYRGARWARATQVNPPHTAGQQVILLWHIFI